MPDYKHIFTMIGLILFVALVWTMIFLSIRDYATYGDYPILTHNPNASE